MRLHLSIDRWHRGPVTELRSLREQIGVSQSQLADMLGASLHSLRMWDSGMRSTPDDVLERTKVIAAEAVRDQHPMNLPELARELHVHVRTLQAAARTGRLEVRYATRSVFGRALRLSTRAAGRAFLQTFYKRYSGQPAGSFPAPTVVPIDYASRLRKLRRRLAITQADLAELVGAANNSVVYQWESGKRVPSPVFWERVSRLEGAATPRRANLPIRLEACARSSAG
jgi:DNA-binding transcriptional regulator YiaG